MGKKLRIIDHTAEKILTMASSPEQKSSLLGLLNRYDEIACFEISFAAWRDYGELLAAYPHRVVLYSPAERRPPTGPNTLVLPHGRDRDLSRLCRELDIVAGCCRKFYLWIPDASAWEPTQWRSLGEAVAGFPVDGLIYQDGDGSLDPFLTDAALKGVAGFLPCGLEFRAGNQNGLATANALAALRSNACLVHGSVSGVLPNAGAAIEELILAHRHLYGEGKSAGASDTSHLAADFRRILGFLGVEVPPHKAVIGEAIFAHESGLHVAGVIRNPGFYEALCPEEVGLTRRLVIGKHSGRTAVGAKLAALGVTVDDIACAELTALVKDLSQRQKRALADAELLALYDSLQS